MRYLSSSTMTAICAVLLALGCVVAHQARAQESEVETITIPVNVTFGETLRVASLTVPKTLHPDTMTPLAVRWQLTEEKDPADLKNLRLVIRLAQDRKLVSQTMYLPLVARGEIHPATDKPTLLRRSLKMNDAASLTAGKEVYPVFALERLDDEGERSRESIGIQHRFRELHSVTGGWVHMDRGATEMPTAANARPYRR